MERDRAAISSAQRGDPFCRLPHFLLRVIFFRNDELGDLDMTSVRCCPDKILDHLKVPTDEFTVEFLCKTLEIDIHGINMGEDLLQDLLRGHTVGDQNCLHAEAVKKLCRIPHELPSHQGFVIGKSNADIASVPQIQCQITELLRGVVLGIRSLLPGCGDLIILAEGTAQTASEASDRQDPAARIKAGQRLFFNGIQSKCRQLSVIGSGNPSLFIAAGTAGTGLPFLKSAVMTADIACGLHNCKPGLLPCSFFVIGLMNPVSKNATIIVSLS